MDAEQRYKQTSEWFEKAAFDGKLRWISTLTIGNGAALFAVFTFGMDEAVAQLHPVAIVAAWSFLTGVVAASFAYVSLTASAFHHHGFWRLSSTQVGWRSIEDERRALEMQPSIDTAGKRAAESDLSAGIAALVSSCGFIIGVASPLCFMTLKMLAH